MGGTVCRAVHADPDLELVAAVDVHRSPPAAPGAGPAVANAASDLPGGLELSYDLEALERAGAEVAVDFTERAAAMANLAWCADHGVHAVVGTTGLGEADVAEVGERFTRNGSPNCVLAPNFAIGAVLMMRFAEMAAPWFDSAEIVELHHDTKVDAPSGTAMLTAARMAAVSAEWSADPTRSEVLAGARGGVGPAGIRVHSVRLRGLVAHQEVLLGAAGQTLTIRHDSYDRESFMPGVVIAIKAVAGRPGLTVGLDQLLGA